MGLGLAAFLAGCVFGALAMVAAEVLVVLVLLDRLSRKVGKSEASLSAARDVDHQQSLDSARRKQGDVWVLEPERVPKGRVEKAQREQKRKNDFFEVLPVRKHAIIKDHSLIFTEADGSPTAIPLKGCVIEAVSATDLSSRKWAKRYPIKLESKSSAIYKGSKVFYIYLETSWEKESWCKALRLASCDDRKRLTWFSMLDGTFKSYLASLHEEYPSFMKTPAPVYTESIDRENRTDGSSSRVRLFWKKFTKKVSKAGIENKSSWVSSSSREERKMNERLIGHQDSASAPGSLRASPPQHSLSLPHSRSQGHISVVSDVDSDDKFGVDEGTICWNLLISRLFFDAKSNEETKRSLQSRIQRTLSNMRTPSYIGEVLCTDIEIGDLPPYIHGMRIIPQDMSEIWAFEVDVEYSGGVILDIETRLEVHELDLQNDISNSEEVSPDLLEDFEHLRKQLNLSEGGNDALEEKGESDPKLEGMKSSKSNMSATHKSRWKSILNTIAKQVSQVPLTLRIKVASLRGTLRVQIKPPPSDQLWFGFSSMPDIEFNLESSVGEHRVTSGHIASFLINRFKVSIHDTMVLPNCESLRIPWMLAEKNDWVPRKAAPFIWLSQEGTKDLMPMIEKPCSQPVEAKPKTDLRRQASSGHSESKQQKVNAKDLMPTIEKPCSQPVEAKLKTELSRQPSSGHSESKQQKLNNADPEPTSTSEPLVSPGPTNAINLQKRSISSQELTTPLLLHDEPRDDSQRNGETPVAGSPSRSIIISENQDQTMEHDDARPKRMGTRARMFDLGKKMGEKLERRIEEKRKHIVEKMRGPT
ncbi:uncharacterized protein LOC115665086 isoform X2 [Syzygium oleosum]|uniref:uncharacterized protein LOC115665086 isoform X2 n=1 Tax=Syzygium oleosum TaxID=219896 RepID=UPI0024BB42EC|nr:uncharacterized protein LOC115665086 isoform X2 [Syzygium oleosum]